MFINREKELTFLQNKWIESTSQLIILWGKRRVGKTELVKQFVKNKPHVYYLAQSTHETEQLKRFSEALGDFFQEPLLLTRGFATWEESFSYLKQKNRRLVLIVDEFPYLIQSNSAIPSIFQKGWDEYLSECPIYLILLGSSVGMMETEVLGYRAPLYGRRSGQWKLKPMPFSQVRDFRPEASFHDHMLHYSVCGGIPAYWEWFAKKHDFYQNLAHHALSKGEPLYDEVEFILRAELREPRYYFSLLQAIAQGKRKLAEIVNSTGIIQPTANKYLGVLADLDIVEREIPVTEQIPLKSKKGLYRIRDEFFQFWFRFIFTGRADLEMDRIDTVVQKIKQDMPGYLGSIYEKVAGDIVMENMGFFFPMERLGRWWDRFDEIDLVGLSHKENSLLCGEVKWSRNLVGENVFRELKAKSERIPWGNKRTRRCYVLFSRSGFTQRMLALAENEDVVLFKGEEKVK